MTLRLTVRRPRRHVERQASSSERPAAPRGLDVRHELRRPRVLVLVWREL